MNLYFCFWKDDVPKQWKRRTQKIIFRYTSWRTRRSVIASFQLNFNPVCWTVPSIPVLQKQPIHSFPEAFLHFSIKCCSILMSCTGSTGAFGCWINHIFHFMSMALGRVGVGIDRICWRCTKLYASVLKLFPLLATQKKNTDKFSSFFKIYCILLWMFLMIDTILLFHKQEL